MNPLHRSFRRLAGSLALAALALGLTAAPALAAPQLQVKLTRQASEVQSVFVKASGGQFRLEFEGEFTPDLAFDASQTTVEAALNNLETIKSGGNGSVKVEGSGRFYVVSFTGGPLANTDVPHLVAVDGTVPLSGGGSRAIVRTDYEAEVSRSDRILTYVANVKNIGTDPTSGTVTLEVELPSGLETSVVHVFLGGGSPWTCGEAAAVGVTPAKVTCTRTSSLAPGASYPAVAVLAGLGADIPDHAIAKATVSGGLASSASGTDEFDFAPAKAFGFQEFDSEVIGADGGDYTQAGGHPFLAAISFQLSTARRAFNSVELPIYKPVEDPSKVVVDLPRGLVANALAVANQCPSVEDVIAATCPPDSAVGLIDLDVALNSSVSELRLPIISIKPELGAPAQFAFYEPNVSSSFTLTPRLRPDDGYAISLDATPAPFLPAVRRLNEGGFCSFGAKVSGNAFEGCREASDPAANSLPLVTNPTRCTGTPPTSKVSANSWEHPGSFVSREVSDPLPTGCENVDFQPQVSITPTNHQADTPTGVKVEMVMPTDGLEDPTGISQAALDNAVITFPRGMSLNPAAAQGLGSCSEAQVKLGSNDDDECPLSSQVGTIEIETPLLGDPLTGRVFLAKQKENPFKSTLGIYLVFSSKKDGVTIKVAGKLEADPVTGQLTSSFVENPELPFSRLAIKFNSGPRAPLINPPKCGSYAIHSELSPWSALSPANPTASEIAASDSVFEVTAGPNGGPCPTGALDPKLDAGLTNSKAGSKSPFVMKLSREDGSARFTGLDLSLPPGLTAYLKGVPYCPEHVLAAISDAELTGRSELASPACPAASQVGTVQAGAGSGPYPFYAPGRVYLAGPYRGAPLSFAIVTPAVAGPLDLGSVVVRNAIHIDPVSARISVLSDPIPTILHGIPLDVRDIRVNVDRSNFTAAPTNCEPMSIGATVKGEGGTTATVSNRFQVGNCKALGFKPKLALRLFGGTKRGAHPRLRAVLKARPGDANIAGTSVALPHSEFLDQAHIRTICTRVQFAANACPAGAIYGYASATTPLLDNDLSGPVYLRSSDNPLPDLVAVLRGPDSQPIEVDLDGRIDSKHGGIRSSFEAVPDQPVSSFTLNMQGGKKGLLVNSRNICRTVNKATAKFIAQNGRKATLRPVLKNSCKKHKKQRKHRKHKRHR